MHFNLCHSLILVLFGYTVTAYNLEERLPLYKRGPVNSTFGFSVTMHKTSNPPLNNLANSILVIGSPTASALSNQPDTINPGGIFYCPVNTISSDCDRVEMDQGGSEKENNKTGQWLGVSVKSQGEGKLLVTCGHRYASRSGSGVNEFERLCGKCFLLNETESNGLREITPSEVGNQFIASPCDNKISFYTDYPQTLAYSQAGVSIAMVGDEYITGDTRVIDTKCMKSTKPQFLFLNEPRTIRYQTDPRNYQPLLPIAERNKVYKLDRLDDFGGPGAWSWSGAMFGSSLSAIFKRDDNVMFETLGCTDQEASEGPVRCERIPLRRDSYLGFSVATSNALGKYANGGIVYIAGAPKGNLTGAVVFYNKVSDSVGTNLVPIMDDVVMGELIGSSFGFSVIATDLNADGLDDLIVGAPQYYHYSNEGKYGGAVYVYISDTTRPFSEIKAQKFNGPLDSFFGYSLASLGDVDQDGYNDFAVGSPYESPSGKVLIYRGSADGIVKQSQEIDGAKYLGISPNMIGFGISLSGNVDIDNNEYPDLLVGTLKDQAILFRSRPTIKVNSSLVVSLNLLNVSHPSCMNNGEEVLCFDLQYCFSYNSTHDEYTGALNISYKITLDGDRQHIKLGSRASFNSPYQHVSVMESVVTIPVEGRWICPGGFHRVYFNENSEDKLSPIAIDFKFSLESDSRVISPEAPGKPIFQMINDPILDADYVTERKAVVNLANNCGNDGCQSNLKVDGSFPEEIFVGATEKAILNLIVSNDGEDAYLASVSIKVPSRVDYVNFAVPESSGAKINCFSKHKGDSTFVFCSLGNPYRSNSMDKIDIYFDVTRLTADIKEIEVEVTGSTTSTNPDLSPFPLVSKVIIEMMMSLSSYGKPQQVRYHDVPVRGESAMRYTDQIGPMINYTFIIKNEGARTASGVILNVEFPKEINNGKWLLYLVSTRVSAGGIKAGGACSEDQTNPLHIDLPIATIARRSKREASSKQDNPTRLATFSGPGEYAYHHTLSCKDKTAKCVNISCKIDSFPSGSTVSVFFQARLWNYTFLEEFLHHDLVNVLTVAELTNVESNVKIIGNVTSQQIRTTVDHAFLEKDITSVFPWWYVLLGIIILLLIYIIVIFLLIKCGFFKRKRFPSHEHDEDEDALVAETNEKENEKAV